ncbi:MAG: LuxR C-terminal-related transcriptional regulator [bacterium]
MPTADVLDRGRDAYARQSWADAYARLAEADRATHLEPGDLERLATAAYLTGNEAGAVTVLTRAYHALVDLGEIERAARCGFWLSHHLLLAGDQTQSRGWLSRTQRLLDDRQLDCLERGYLLVIVALYAIGANDAAGSYTTSCQLSKIAEQFGDPDLATFGLLCRGKALIELGETAEAMELLDEAIVAVASREVSPIASGIVCCAAILACRNALDLHRTHRWTTVLSDWCDSQPDLVPFRGQCLVHRSEIMQLRGTWPDALAEARKACERLAAPTEQPALGMAYYQRAELHRLRGDLAAAEQSYRDAHQHGREPQPGLALLRLAQGRVEAAASTIRRLAEQSQDGMTRVHTLAACVEIMLAAGEVAAARAAADELAATAANRDVPLLRAESAHAMGAVLLAEGDPKAALAALQAARAAWHELDAPYQTARVGVLAGLACRQLGDEDTAHLEWDAARDAFRKLEAGPDLTRLAALSGGPAAQAGGGLSPREQQVLGLVAAGRSNREIADELVISDKTVERHLSNIFTKIGVVNRAGATAYAYRRGLV